MIFREVLIVTATGLTNTNVKGVNQQKAKEKREEEEKGDNPLTDAMKNKWDQRLLESRGIATCPPIALTCRVPKHTMTVFNLNHFQSKQLIYIVCYSLSKRKKKVGNEGKN